MFSTFVRRGSIDPHGPIVDLSTSEEEDANGINRIFAITVEKISAKIPRYSTVNDFRMDPLCMLIKYVITDGTMKKEVITQLDKQLLNNILKMFTRDYTDKVLNQSTKNKMQISYEIDVNCLIKFIQVWKGWKKYNFKTVIRKEAYDDLYSYLRTNLIKVQNLKERFATRQLGAYGGNQESIIYLTCSLKQLRSAFYQEPLKSSICIHMEPNLEITSFNAFEIPWNQLYNWPHIRTEFKLPGFTMVHENVNYDEYYVINLPENTEPDSEPQCTKLYYKSSKYSEKIDSAIVIQFLDKLKSLIHTSTIISNLKKNELLDALIEFTHDVLLCATTIECKSHYYKNLNRHPYVRYFGYKGTRDDSNMFNVSMGHQKMIGNTKLNLRLKQTCYPRFTFSLEDFRVLCKYSPNETVFNFSDKLLNSFTDCITYKCTVCATKKFFTNHYAVSNHLMEFHGIEPEWICRNCKRIFSTNSLSISRWHHNCNGIF